MFNAEKERDKIVSWIQNWFERNGKDCNAVIGISGGKDSTVVAALCKEALGAERVIGVLMPNGIQYDIQDSIDICNHLEIKYYEINIDNAYNSLLRQVFDNLRNENNAVSEQTEHNLPPRLRMATLYAVSQSINGRVANTCNLSETMVGWETKWGDAVGDFSPLANYTATEVVQIGRTLNIPERLVEKTPSDGLCGKSDEDAFGFSYLSLDSFLRTGSSGNEETDEKIHRMIRNSKHKRKETEKCPGPEEIKR